MSHPSAAYITSIFERSVISGAPSMMTSILDRHWTAPGATMPTDILRGVSQLKIDKFQIVQNALSRVVLRAHHRTDAAPLLAKLHWLPIERRILLKLATLTFKSLDCGQPSYLSILLKRYVASSSTTVEYGCW